MSSIDDIELIIRDLMMVTSTGEGFLNEENFLFFKFNTRDIYNQLKINGT